MERHREGSLGLNVGERAARIDALSPILEQDEAKSEWDRFGLLEDSQTLAMTALEKDHWVSVNRRLMPALVLALGKLVEILGLLITRS